MEPEKQTPPALPPSAPTGTTSAESPLGGATHPSVDFRRDPPTHSASKAEVEEIKRANRSLFHPATKPHSKKKIIGAILLAMILINGFEPFLIWLAVSPIGSKPMLVFAELLQLSFIIAILAIPTILAVSLIPDIRKTCFLAFCLCLFYIFTTGYRVSLGDHIRKRGFSKVSVRLKPLIAAIDQYTIDSGAPPKTLENLVPKYINRLPDIGIGAYPEYKYYTQRNDPDGFHGNQWMIIIDAHFFPFDFDDLRYYPKKNYDEIEHAIITLMGDWAFLECS